MTDFLADTNVLLRFAQRIHPLHPVVRTAIRTLHNRGDRVCCTPQNLVEFWNVCTRPATARGGFGLTPAQADHAMRLVERLFVLLPDNAHIYPEWRQLVMHHAVIGVQVHDARLIAAMHVHALSDILTFNTTDFTRYTGITAVDPASV